MSSTICPLYNEYHEPLRWTFTEPLGTCLYNIYDEISFIVGWLSVLSWTFALLPQIITNCKNKAAESQSFWFWLLWLLGDFCNFGGCILTKNLITNIALALVYLSFTAFACLQFIWYEYLLKKYNFTKQREAYKQKQLLFNKSVSISNISNVSNKSLTITNKSFIDSDAAIWTTPNFAKRYSAPTKDATQFISPKLKKTLKILSRSPRMFALSSQLTRRMRREYEAFQSYKRQQEHHLFPEQFLDNKYEYSNNSISKSDSYLHEPRITPHITPRTTPRIIKPHGNSISNNETETSDTIQNQLQNQLQNPTNSVPLRATINPNYGSMSTIISTLSSMSVTIVMLYNINNYELSNSNSNNNGNGKRILLSNNNNNNNGNEQILIFIGMILGWTSSLIYISSRIPQLKLMLITKAVSGINPAFFCLTFSGNLTQCLSMLINKQIYSNVSDLFNKLPWLASSGVCIFQDGFILFLIYLYNTEYYKSLSAMKRIDFQNINNISYESYSKGVMMPSPHYLVTQNDKRHITKKKIKNKYKSSKKRRSQEFVAMGDIDRGYYEYKKNRQQNKNKNIPILTNTV